MNAAERKSLKRANDSKIAWKTKAMKRNSALRAARTRIRDLEKSRQMWRQRAAEEPHNATGQPALSSPSPGPSPPSPSTAPRTIMIALCINLTLNCCVSFRSVPKILRAFQQVLLTWGLPADFHIPHFTTVIRWTLRVGMFVVNTAVTQRIARWICIMDHTIQVGSKKAFVVLRVPVERVKQLRALTLKDVEVLAIKVQDTWNGPEVQKVLEQVFSRVGVPVQVVSDAGPDLQKGLKNLLALPEFSFKATIDITHMVATVLRRKYQKHEQFTALLAHLSTTKCAILQTSLAYLMPLKNRTKARFLNLPSIAKWTRQIMDYMQSLPEPTPDEQDAREQLQRNFSWLFEYQEFLTQFWNELSTLTHIQRLIKTQGLTEVSYRHVCTLLIQLTDPAVKDPLEKYLETEFVCATQTTDALLLTSDVIESLFGKYKYLAKPHSLSEINRMIFALPCLCEDITPELVEDAFSTLTQKEFERCCDQEISETLLSKRRKAFPPQRHGEPDGSGEEPECVEVPSSSSIATEYHGQETAGTPLTLAG